MDTKYILQSERVSPVSNCPLIYLFHDIPENEQRAGDLLGMVDRPVTKADTNPIYRVYNKGTVAGGQGKSAT